VLNWGDSFINRVRLPEVNGFEGGIAIAPYFSSSFFCSSSSRAAVISWLSITLRSATDWVAFERAVAFPPFFYNQLTFTGVVSLRATSLQFSQYGSPCNSDWESHTTYWPPCYVSQCLLNRLVSFLPQRPHILALFLQVVFTELTDLLSILILNMYINEDICISMRICISMSLGLYINENMYINELRLVYQWECISMRICISMSLGLYINENYET
jgi:hypothetical protein